MASYGFCFRPSTRRGGTAPGRLYMRIIHGGESRSVTTEYRIFSEEWDSVGRRLLIPYGRGERARQLNEIENQMLCDARRMEMVIDSLHQWGAFTADELISRYRAVMTGNTLAAFSERLASRLDTTGNHRTAKAYRSAVARFRNFLGGRNISLDQLSSHIMGDFQQSLKAEGCSLNTISFYMRMLRAIYNKAVAEGRTSRRAESIFGGVYTGLTQTRKLALTADDLTRLSALDPTEPHVPGVGKRKRHELPPHLAQALAMFLFCYHARGMCFVDMAHLKRSNLRGNTISYRRQKTGQLIELLVVPVMRRIIDWFAPQTAGSEYLFPVLFDPDKDPTLQYESGLRLQNQRLKKIAARCRIDKRFSSHCARHSWATIAKNANLPLAVISEGLGHSNQKTTEIYLASLERSILDDASRIVSNAISATAAGRPKRWDKAASTVVKEPAMMAAMT